MPSGVFYAEPQEWRCSWGDGGMYIGLNQPITIPAIHTLFWVGLDLCVKRQP